MVNLNISANICENLEYYENYTNQVQEEVSKLQIVGNYIETIPTIFMSALLGTYINIKIVGPKIYFFAGKSPSRHKQIGIFHFAGTTLVQMPWQISCHESKQLGST